MDGNDRELSALLAELDGTLEALREELADGRRRRASARRMPLRPPTPRELLRITEEYTIPTLVAVLEANVRLLELTRRALRLADPERAARAEAESARDALGDAARGGADAAGRAAVDRLDSALSELRTALAEADLPEEGEARSLVVEARELADAVEARLPDDGGDRPAAAGRAVPVEEPDPEAGVDVESELRSIRDEVDEEPP